MNYAMHIQRVSFEMHNIIEQNSTLEMTTLKSILILWFSKVSLYVLFQDVFSWDVFYTSLIWGPAANTYQAYWIGQHY